MSKNLSKALIFLFLLTVFFSQLHDGFAQPPETSSFRWVVGEELTYKVKWTFIKLGELKLKILKKDTLNDRPVYHCRINVDSRPGLPFITIHDVWESYIDSAYFYSHQFNAYERDGSDLYYTTYKYDLKNKNKENIMRICANCGATNRDDKDKFCRTCGAMLPVKRPPRIRMGSSKLKKEENKDRTTFNTVNSNKPAINNNNRFTPPQNVESQFFTSKQTNNQELNKLNLQEIPKVTPKQIPQSKPSIASKPKVKELKTINISDNKEDDKRFLREIKPKPFSGSIIASREVYGSPKSNVIEKQNQENQLSNTSTTILNKSATEDAIYKRKRLEEDMTNVLGFLSEKLKSINLEKKQESKSKPTKERLLKNIDKIGEAIKTIPQDIKIKGEKYENVEYAGAVI